MNLKNPLAHDCPYIIHVVRQYAPAVGGLENFVQSLAQQQALRGAAGFRDHFEPKLCHGGDTAAV